MVIKLFNFIKKQIQDPSTFPVTGDWGVMAEPRNGQMKSSTWITQYPLSYDDAMKKADYMNRANNQWFYYAKPLMKG
jgi:hypothetical protein